MWGEGTNAAENSGYFPACSAVVMSTPARNKISKKITSKLELGLNFAVNVDFWVCNDDFNKKLKAKT